jgi:hypothetical protein
MPERAGIGFGQRQIGVEQAKHLLRSRVGVTGGGRAAGLILNGLDDGQHAVAAGAIDAECMGGRRGGERSGRIVATDAFGRGAIDVAVEFTGVGGVSDAAVLINDADAGQAALARHGAHHLA